MCDFYRDVIYVFENDEIILSVDLYKFFMCCSEGMCSY